MIGMMQWLLGRGTGYRDGTFGGDIVDCLRGGAYFEIRFLPLEVIYEREALGVCAGEICVGRVDGGGFVCGAGDFCAGADWRGGACWRCCWTFAEFLCGEDAW